MKYQYSIEEVNKLFTDWYGQTNEFIGETFTDDEGTWIIREQTSEGNYRIELEDGSKSINVTAETLNKFLND